MSLLVFAFLAALAETVCLGQAAVTPQSNAAIRIAPALAADASQPRMLLSSLRESTADTIAPRAKTQDLEGAPVNPSVLVSEAPLESPGVSRAEKPVRHTLSREAVLTALQAQVGAHYSVEGELQLELQRPWIDPTPAASPYTITISEFPNQLASSLLVRARLEAGGAPATEITISLRAQLWREVWATRVPVSREDVFEASVLETRRVDCLRERDAVPVSAGDRTQTFARNIPAGRILGWRDLTRRSLVRKGELVDVTANDGPLSVNMKAMAMQSGAAGDTIMVRNIESKKDIAALIVAENRVKVRF